MPMSVLGACGRVVREGHSPGDRHCRWWAPFVAPTARLFRDQLVGLAPTWPTIAVVTEE